MRKVANVRLANNTMAAVTKSLVYQLKGPIWKLLVALFAMPGEGRWTLLMALRARHSGLFPEQSDQSIGVNLSRSRFVSCKCSSL